MTECDHTEVDLTDWRGEAGTVICRDCQASCSVFTAYGWDFPETTVSDNPKPPEREAIWPNRGDQ